MIRGDQTNTTLKQVREQTDELVGLIAPLVTGRDLAIVAGVMLAIADTVVSAVNVGASKEEKEQVEFQVRTIISMARDSLSVRIKEAGEKLSQEKLIKGEG